MRYTRRLRRALKIEMPQRTLHHSPSRVTIPAENFMTRQIVHTDAAPQAIGTYSQAVRCGSTVYLAGQIGLDPATMEMTAGIDQQIRRVLENLQAVAIAAGGSLNDVVKLTVYLTDLGNFARVNEIMATFFSAPYPARAALGVSSLPRGALVEMDAIMHLGD
jgi:reactive intermediate/imine deaminase